MHVFQLSGHVSRVHVFQFSRHVSRLCMRSVLKTCVILRLKNVHVSQFLIMNLGMCRAFREMELAFNEGVLVPLSQAHARACVPGTCDVMQGTCMHGSV